MRKYLFVVFFLLLLLPVPVLADVMVFNTSGDGDAYLLRDDGGVGTAWATMQASTASQTIDKTGNSMVIYEYSWTPVGYFYQFYRVATQWNTSELPEGITITEAIGSVRVSAYADTGSVTPGFAFSHFAPATPGTIVTGDFDLFGDIESSIQSYPTGTGYKNLTLDSNGIASISTSGWSSFMIRDTYDINNTMPSMATFKYFSLTFSTSEATYPAKLYVTYTTGGGADTTPPPSISGLTNTTTCNSINFTWKNPTDDEDFNHTYLMKGGVWETNLSNTTAHYLWSGLNGWKAYSINITTVDITGNMNTTGWQNQTAQTSPICIIEGILRNWFWRTPARLMT